MFGQVINRIEKIEDFGYEQGKGCGKRAAHPTQFFWERLPSPTSPRELERGRPVNQSCNQSFKQTRNWQARN